MQNSNNNNLTPDTPQHIDYEVELNKLLKLIAVLKESFSHDKMNDTLVDLYVQAARIQTTIDNLPSVNK